MELFGYIPESCYKYSSLSELKLVLRQTAVSKNAKIAAGNRISYLAIKYKKWEVLFYK